MPLGVALSELRYELRAEIYSSLLPAHGLSAVDMQNAILERTQRELWNLYAWPHLNYRLDFIVPANTQFVNFDPTMPFENVLSLWRNDNPSNQQPWLQLRYGFEDWINETLHSWPTHPVAQRGHGRQRERPDQHFRPGAALADPDPGRAHALEWASAAQSAEGRQLTSASSIRPRSC